MFRKFVVTAETGGADLVCCLFCDTWLQLHADAGILAENKQVFSILVYKFGSGAGFFAYHFIYVVQ